MGYWNIDYSLAETTSVTETAVNYKGTITASELNVRSRPSTSATILGKHVTGDVVDICAVTSNGWYKVIYPSYTGYLYGEYVKTTPIATVDDEDITQEEFNELMTEYLKSLANQEPSAWSSDARNYVETQGIIEGDD